MPPNNFPTGCTPIFVDSFEEAIKEARKRTKDGILVIKDIDMDDKANYLKQTKEKWKRYDFIHNDFKENENPYKFLQEGNVLCVECEEAYGFEWKTVILFEREIKTSSASDHDCNLMMRCTTNLIVLRKEKDLNPSTAH